MNTEDHEEVPSQSAKSGSGSAYNVSGHANTTNTQTVTVSTHKPSKMSGIVVPLLAAVISGVGGAYATHQLALMRADETSRNGTETLLGIAKGAIEVAQANKASPELLQKLETLASQAQSVQASLQATHQPPGTASLQADFWLSVGHGAKLPKEGTVGLNKVVGPGDIWISFNDGGGRIPSGKKLEYKGNDGTKCYLVYVGAAPDEKLHGFKTWCGS
jgi:hypothetical protein